MSTVDSLTRRYASFTAVDNVSFAAQPGRVTGFLEDMFLSLTADTQREGVAA